MAVGDEIPHGWETAMLFGVFGNGEVGKIALVAISEGEKSAVGKQRRFGGDVEEETAGTNFAPVAARRPLGAVSGACIGDDALVGGFEVAATDGEQGEGTVGLDADAGEDAAFDGGAAPMCVGCEDGLVEKDGGHGGLTFVWWEIQGDGKKDDTRSRADCPEPYAGAGLFSSSGEALNGGMIFATLFSVI